MSDSKFMVIVILKGIADTDFHSPQSRLITFEELKHWVLGGGYLKKLFGYREAKLVCFNQEFISKPFLTTVLVRSLGRRALIKDLRGTCQEITGRMISQLGKNLVRDWRAKKKLLSQVLREVEALQAEPGPLFSKSLQLEASPVYLRTDLAFGLQSGGSVGHIAGVLNNLEHFSGKPIFLTTDIIPTVRDVIEKHIILPQCTFWDFKELPELLFNQSLTRNVSQILQDRNISFFYQRYSLNNFSGVKLAHQFKKPLILEYNGSEIWVARNWGRPLKYEPISEAIELLNLNAAQVVVVVSQPLAAELIHRGIEPDKILVNPNGVDQDRYSPEVDGSGVRNKYSLQDKTVIGFIGTFGKWHGAEVLAEAFGRLLQAYPAYRDRVRLLMIGDGVNMPLVKEIIARVGIADVSILTGLVPQAEGPGYLAACDILASPHVPNPDGTPFFGSPTKLFEYMAMGKGIVASNLDQIGEVLQHERTAWMVEPGDLESLMYGLQRLIDQPELRIALGQAARREVVANYTWKKHTAKIIGKLRECCESLK